MKKPTPIKPFEKEYTPCYFVDDLVACYTLKDMFSHIRKDYPFVTDNEMIESLWFKQYDDDTFSFIFSESDDSFQKRKTEYDLNMIEYTEYTNSNKSKLDKIAELEKEIDKLKSSIAE